MDAEATATPDKQGLLTMTVGALVGILALLAYLFMGSRNETLEVQKLLTTKVEQFAATQTRLDSISTVLDEKIAAVNRLGGSVAELERIKRQLETDKKKLKYDLTFSIQKYSLKIRDYTNFLKLHEDDTQKLRAENGTLLSRTRTLEREKQSIITENEGLKQEKEALAQTVVSYSVQNADLKTKVTLAAAPKAINVDVAALSANGKERRGGAYKSSRIDQLKVAFVLLSNPVALPTDKEIYVRLLDANGAVVNTGGLGGVIVVDGREIGYSTRQTVPAETDDQRVDILFRRDASYKPGIYTVELYTEGFRIGEGRFEVK